MFASLLASAFLVLSAEPAPASSPDKKPPVIFELHTEPATATNPAKKPMTIVVEIGLLWVPESDLDRIRADMKIRGDDRVALLKPEDAFGILAAAQGSAKSNLLATPVLRLPDGQTSTLDVTSKRSFITGVDIHWDGEQVVTRPKRESFQEGLQFEVKPVVSADRRTVRVNFECKKTDIDLNVRAVPITSVITPISENSANVALVPHTVQLQMPKFVKHELKKELTMPDGQTALIYGWKEAREGRRENGVPVLNKVPYFNRLFKNVGYGREDKHFLVLVTPRIVVPEEEEERLGAASVSDHAAGP